MVLFPPQLGSFSPLCGGDLGHRGREGALAEKVRPPLTFLPEAQRVEKGALETNDDLLRIYVQ